MIPDQPANTPIVARNAMHKVYSLQIFKIPVDARLKVDLKIHRCRVCSDLLVSQSSDSSF
jgi:hypothetical protein